MLTVSSARNRRVVMPSLTVVRHKIIGATNMTALEAKITAVIRGG
jgi:hypothetical protein